MSICADDLSLAPSARASEARERVLCASVPLSDGGDAAEQALAAATAADELGAPIEAALPRTLAVGALDSTGELTSGRMRADAS